MKLIFEPIYPSPHVFNVWRGEQAHILAVATPLVTREPQPIWRGESAVTGAFTPRATNPSFLL